MRFRQLVTLSLAAVIIGCGGQPTDNNGGASGHAVFVGGDGVFSPDFVKLAEGAAEGAYIITPYVNDTGVPFIAEFSKAFEAKNGEAPDAWAALTYDALGTICAAMAKVGPDRKKVRDALAAMNTPETGYSGVTGLTVFDVNGDCTKPAIVAEVKGSKLVKSELQMAAGDAAAPPAKPAAGQAATGAPIKIGIAGPFTGQNQRFGDMIKKGATLKAEEINAAGGINGRPIALKFGDDEGNNARAANVANDFASDPEIIAVVGHFNSTCSLTAKPKYKEAGIPAISPGSTNVDVCIDSDFMFRNLYRDDFQGYTIAEFVKNKLKKTKVVVFFDNDDYGTGLKNFFVKKAKELGLTIAEPIPYEKQTTDFTALVTKAKFEEPEVIFVAGLYNHAADIVKACKRAGITK